MPNELPDSSFHRGRRSTEASDHVLISLSEKDILSRQGDLKNAFQGISRHGQRLRKAPVHIDRAAGRHFFASAITWQASFTELPREIVDLLKMTSPSLLNTAILLWCVNKAFPPSWSSVITKSALSKRFVTVICGQRWFSVLIISAV